MRFDCTFLEASGVAALQEHPFAPISALQEATLGSDLATPRTCTSAKAGCAERQYTVEQLRLAAHSILAAAKSGKPLAAAAAARLQGVPSMRRSLTRLMEQVWALDGPDRDQAGFGLDRWLVRSDYIAAYEFAVKGNDDFAARRIFSEQDDALIKEGCDLAAASGLGLDFITVRDIMNIFIAKEDLKDPFSGHLYKPTLTFVRKWAKRVGVKVYKTSSISKERAIKATVEIRDEWFGLVETYVRELHARGLIPWATYDHIPDSCKYNYDEEAPNPEKGRAKVLASKRNDPALRRLFDLGHDGKMAVHVTDGMTTCADGRLCATYLLKARGGGSAKKAAAKRKAGEEVKRLEPKDADKSNLLDAGAPDGETLNIGIGVTPNGSMTLEEFPFWCRHFNEYCVLPTQGGRIEDNGVVIKEGGQPVLLFIDAHASRWGPSAFAYLMENNIFPICVPSHTTIWSQPNDAGCNAAAKHWFGTIVREQSASIETAKGKEAFNAVFRASVVAWRKELAEGLSSAARTNAIKSAWRRVGLGGKLNPNCEMWTAAIATFGEGSMLHTSLRTIRAAIFAAADAAAAEEDAASDAASAHADEDVDMQPAAAPLRLVLGLSAEQMLQAERSERLLTALRDARTMSVELRGATDDFDVKALEVTAVAQRRGTRIVITPTDEDGEAVTLFTSQLEDHCDEDVKRVCLQYRLAREVGSSSSVSLAKQQARERRLKLALVAEQAKQLHEAQLEELRARVEARVKETGELDAELWRQVRVLHATPPPVVIDGVLVRCSVALTTSLLNSLTLVSAMAEKLANHASTVMQVCSFKIQQPLPIPSGTQLKMLISIHSLGRGRPPRSGARGCRRLRIPGVVPPGTRPTSRTCSFVPAAPPPPPKRRPTRRRARRTRLPRSRRRWTASGPPSRSAPQGCCASSWSSVMATSQRSPSPTGRCSFAGMGATRRSGRGQTVLTTTRWRRSGQRCPTARTWRRTSSLGTRARRRRRGRSRGGVMRRRMRRMRRRGRERRRRRGRRRRGVVRRRRRTSSGPRHRRRPRRCRLLNPCHRLRMFDSVLHVQSWHSCR
jgi:hypothetical protein